MILPGPGPGPGVGAAFRFRLPPTLHFGRGSAPRVAEGLAELGVARPLVVTDPGVRAAGAPERVREVLAGSGMAPAVWDGSAPDPDEGHVEACAEALAAGGHDAVVAVGGGSVLDVAKVAAVLATNGGRTADYWGFDRVRRPGLPLAALPTTAGGGGEVSSHAVILRRGDGGTNGRKEVVAGLHLLPRLIVVDPDFTATLPAGPTLHAALDGLVHAVEAFLARAASPLTDLFAREALPRITRALPRVLADPADADAGEELSLGGLFAGIAMANAGAGAIHALGYPLTARFGIPHGLVNGLMAAGALEAIGAGARRRFGELARLLSGGDGGPAAGLAERLRSYLDSIGVTDTLAAWGVEEGHLPELAEEASRFRPVLDNTPVPLGPSDLLAVYRSEWARGAARLGTARPGSAPAEHLGR